MITKRMVDSACDSENIDTRASLVANAASSPTSRSSQHDNTRNTVLNKGLLPVTVVTDPQTGTREVRIHWLNKANTSHKRPCKEDGYTIYRCTTRAVQVTAIVILVLALTGCIVFMIRQSMSTLQPSFSTFEPQKQGIEHYTPPVYFSVTTLSLGGQTGLVAQMALQAFAKRSIPDFLVVQDAPSPYELELLDDALPGHGRIHYLPHGQSQASSTQSTIKEWNTQGNVYFNKKVWRALEHGTRQFATHDDEALTPRYLFWVRFERTVMMEAVNSTHNSRSYETHDETVLIACVSLSPSGSQNEINSAKNSRIRESDAIVDILRRVESDHRESFADWNDRSSLKSDTSQGTQSARGTRHEAMVIAGDMGDGYSARSLFAPVGLVDPFSYLHIPMEPTYPAIPLTSSGGFRGSSSATPSVRDWIFSNDRVRPLASSVMRFVLPSDVISSHYPVTAVYELLPCGLNCNLDE